MMLQGAISNVYNHESLSTYVPQLVSDAHV